MSSLICLFTTEGEIDRSSDLIASSYEILFRRIFVLELVGTEEYICCFNIDRSIPVNHLRGSMLIHRKKETNTLYTINSLNELIKKENNGFLDKSFVIDWNRFRNKFLIISNENLKIIDTAIYKIINF